MKQYAALTWLATIIMLFAILATGFGIFTPGNGKWKGVVTIGQAMVFTVPFVILSLIAVWFTVLLFRNFSETNQNAEKVLHNRISHETVPHHS